MSQNLSLPLAFLRPVWRVVSCFNLKFSCFIFFVRPHFLSFSFSFFLSFFLLPSFFLSLFLSFFLSPFFILPSSSSFSSSSFHPLPFRMFFPLHLHLHLLHLHLLRTSCYIVLHRTTSCYIVRCTRGRSGGIQTYILYRINRESSIVVFSLALTFIIVCCCLAVSFCRSSLCLRARVRVCVCVFERERERERGGGGRLTDWLAAGEFNSVAANNRHKRGAND